MTPGKPVEAIRYCAFLSYSRHDVRDAEWLQRRLETYRLPRSLDGRSGKRLLPVFRDMSELSAAPDLEIELKAALSRSAHLIVMCSPKAASSQWVNREIELFRALHPDRPVLAALISGNELISFPPALRQSQDGGKTATPLAADLRREHGGRRLALIKLVARIANVGLDQLIQRDAQRRHRQALGIAAAGLLLAAVLLLLLVQAIVAKRDAERQRAAAESLVEFMVGDLRTRLEPLGKLSILDAVGGRALRYYQTEMGDNEPDSLARRARVLRMVGDIQSQQGNLEVALENFRAAADSTGRLLALAPADPQRIFDHAQSVFYIGTVAWQRRDFDGAESAFLEYRDLAEDLVRIDPYNPRWRPEPEYASSNLGTVLLARGRNLSAEAAFSRALTVSKQSAAINPSSVALRLDLAQSHAWLADALQRLGRLSEALAHRQLETAIYIRLLASDPDNRQAAFRLLNAKAAIASIFADLGDANRGLGIMTDVIRQVHKLYLGDQSNATWSYAWFSDLLMGAEIATAAGRPHTAETNLRLASSLLKSSTESHNTVTLTIMRAHLQLCIAKSGLAKRNLHQAVQSSANALGLLGPKPDFRDRSITIIFIEAEITKFIAMRMLMLDISASELAVTANAFKVQRESDQKLDELRIGFREIEQRNL